MAEISWDQWRISSGGPPPEVAVQGHSMLDILCLLKSEIDKLKKSDSRAAISALQNRLDEEKEKHKLEMARLNDKIDKLTKKVNETQSSYDLEDQLHKALDKIKQLESKWNNDIPPTAEAKLNGLESYMSMLENRISQLENKEPVKPQFDLPDKLTERLIRLEQKESTLTDKCSNLADRVRQCEDSTFALSSQQGKMIGDISKLATAIEATQRNLDNVENMTDRHTEDIKELYSSKADISDVNEKFRVAGGASHGHSNHAYAHRDDSSHGDKIRNIEIELKQLANATQEGLNGVQKKTDKKIEFMTNWIIKYLKSLLQNGGNTEETPTDIGKVRCLACDRPTRQNESDGVGPTPPFRQSFGVRKERKLKTMESFGGRTDTGIRGSYNGGESFNLDRNESPSQERPKSAGSKSIHAKAIAMADSYTEDIDDPVQSAVVGPSQSGDAADKGTTFQSEMERKYVNRPISAPYKKH